MVTRSHEKIQKLTTIALLAALTVLLQVVCTFIKFGPVSLTLALTPIIIGAALYGWQTGALLGFVFSFTVYVMGITGADGGFVLMMMEYNAFATTLVCLLKGTAAGAAAGAVYKLLFRKNKTVAALTASMLAPLVNTGLFALVMATVFYGFLSGMASGASSDPLPFLFTGMIGINFIVEFAVNTALGTTVARILAIYRKNH